MPLARQGGPARDGRSEAGPGRPLLVQDPAFCPVAAALTPLPSRTCEVASGLRTKDPGGTVATLRPVRSLRSGRLNGTSGEVTFYGPSLEFGSCAARSGAFRIKTM